MMTVVVLMCVGLSQSSTSPVLTPSVATTFIGGSVRFTCTKYDEDMLIGWNISPPVVYFQDGSSCGINTTLVIDINDVSTNNSLVQCITKYRHNDTSHTSNTGTIIIQVPMSTSVPTISPTASLGPTPSTKSPSPTNGGPPDDDLPGIIDGSIIGGMGFLIMLLVLIVAIIAIIYHICKKR
jgi:hypothetical protein